MALPAHDALVGITFRIDNFLGAPIREGEKWGHAAQEARGANKEIAEGIQRKQSSYLRAEIEATGRTQRATKYLERAVESEDFISYGADGFVIGTETALNDNRIRGYWRGVEFGSDKHVGRVLQGYFRSSEGGRYPAMEARIRMDPRLIQVSKPGTKSNGRFPFPITIRNPIPEYGFLRRGIADYDANVIGEIYERWFAKYNLRIQGN